MRGNPQAQREDSMADAEIETRPPKGMINCLSFPRIWKPWCQTWASPGKNMMSCHSASWFCLSSAFYKYFRKLHHSLLIPSSRRKLFVSFNFPFKSYTEFLCTVCSSLLPISLHFLSLVFSRKVESGDPWVAQRFGACLWPRARSWRPGIESHVRLPVHGACFSLCLCLCLSLSLWLS